jgi:PEP-CTERM motif
MKVKLAILGLVLLCLWGRPAYADTIVDISATWCDICHFGGGPVDFQAQVTVELVTGTFLNLVQQDTFVGTVWEVTGLNGTLNGNPISLMQPPLGDGSWLYYPDFFIGGLWFAVNGQPAWMFWDGGYPTLAVTDRAGIGWNPDVTSAPVFYSATVNTPEPGTLGLVGLGLAFLCYRLKARKAR